MLKREIKKRNSENGLGKVNFEMMVPREKSIENSQIIVILDYSGLSLWFKN